MFSSVIERWDAVEVVLEAEGQYDNPFTDVDLTAHFVHQPSGEEISVDGFYDGESTWRIRFMPLQTGLWKYETRSGDAGLNGQAGSTSPFPAFTTPAPIAATASCWPGSGVSVFPSSTRNRVTR